MKTLNERISEWFEPKPTHQLDSNVGYSKGGRWVWDINDGWSVNQLMVEAYFTDEAANARLLEALPRGAVVRRNDSDCGPQGFDGWECNENAFLSGPVVRDKDRKTAVVLAFCKFAGIDTKLYEHAERCSDKRADDIPRHSRRR